MLAPDAPIVITPTARRLATTIIRPPIPLLPGIVVDALATPGLALLPAHIRDGYGIPWGAGRAAFANAANVLLRLWVRIVPPSWRAMPQARAAERRARHARLATIPPTRH